MTARNDAEYFRERAASARIHAAAATLPEVRRVHAEMADRYAALQSEAERHGPGGSVVAFRGIVPRD